MNLLTWKARQVLKRHSEALFIIAFISADCCLSGWPLAVGTVVAVLYVFLPAVPTFTKLSPAGQISFAKAFVKTRKVQRLGFLLFWMYSVRLLLFGASSAMLFDTRITSLTNTFLNGAQQFAPISFLAVPIVIYFAACFTAVALRARLKATKQDPDLVRQRQWWSGACNVIFLSAFVASILSITLPETGPAYMLSNWLVASTRDANLYNDESPEGELSPNSGYLSAGTDSFRSQATEAGQPTAQSEPYESPSDPYPFSDSPILQGVVPNAGLSFLPVFDAFILTSTSTVLFLLLFSPVQKLHAFLTAFCWRVVSGRSVQNIIEAFLEALRLPTRTLTLKGAHPVLTNTARSLLWVCACFATLFWIFGFCGGPLGNAIHSWMLTSVVEAGFAPDSAVPDSILFEPKLRIFLGAVAALYATGPIAISAAIFLPYAKPRKVSVNCDGLLFAQGPVLSLLGKQFRLWNELQSLTVKTGKKRRDRIRATFTMKFRHGGRVKFSQSQISASDLRVLIDSIDQYAATCAIAPEVHSVCRALEDEEKQSLASDGIADSAVVEVKADDFRSTIFVPMAQGDLIGDTNIRVIKQLASKPLCAVYLAREDRGRMVTVKQFYLADETEETEALSKTLKREYELLSRLDHTGIAKVINCFTVEKSTYLVIDHRLGVDLRRAVEEHGARSEDVVIAWAQQLCEIMSYLHSFDPPIIHRDLTPDNIIAGADGQLRLIDFGAAREFLDGITGTMIGKNCYMAPEQLRGQANSRSDIYSFGATLFFLLTGRDPVPLSQSSPNNFLACSDQLDKLIRDCTEFDEDKRPASFEIVAERLAAIRACTGFRILLSKAEVVV